MTWYELIWMLAFPTVFGIGCIIDGLVSAHCKKHKTCNDWKDDGKGTAFIMCFISLIIGVLICVVNITTNRDFFLKKEIPLNTISTVMTYNGLDVVFDNHEHLVFTAYDEVERWKTGGKFYKQYSYIKRNFGPDESKEQIIIK